jgi:hypothetical protein
VGALDSKGGNTVINREVDAESIGEQLGVEGVGSVVSKVEAYCSYEEQRIELVNEPKILALRQEGSLLLEEEESLVQRLRNAPPPGDLRSRRRKAAYYWGVTILLTLAAFVFSLLSFDPFRLGWKGYLYCLGIAVVTPFLLEQLLEKWNAGRLLGTLLPIACAAALASLVLLAVIRGDLFAEQMKSTAPVIVFDDAQPQAQSQPQPQTQNDFYDATAALLRLVMVLLAVAMELGAGLALHKAWRIGSESSEDWQKVESRLNEVRHRMLAITYEITTLQNEARVFAVRFWRNFYRAMLTHSVRSAMTKLLVATLVLCFVAHGRAVAQDRTTLVVAVDLSQSVAAVDPNHESEFQKNIHAVTKVFAQIPANTHVTVIGITDRSFAQPDILLSATIPDDPGYFGERLKSAQLQLVGAWQARSAKLKPEFRQTDIVGAFMLAGEIFNEQKRRSEKKLVIFSDMRQQTADLDIESPSTVPRFDRIREKGTKIGSASLGGVHVYALGVDGAGKSLSYWRSLWEFWIEYFRSGGASLDSYSALRELPQVVVAPKSGR